MKNNAELIKIRIESERNFAKSLFEKRVEHYPILYQILSDYAKKIKYDRNDIDNLKEFREKIDEWNSKCSLFFSPQTGNFSARFRHFLGHLMHDNVPNSIIENNWEPILYMIGKFERFLKSEIGIIDIKPIGEIDEIKEIDNYMSKCEKNLQLELKKCDIDFEYKGNYLRSNKELFEND